MTEHFFVFFFFGILHLFYSSLSLNFLKMFVVSFNILRAIIYFFLVLILMGFFSPELQLFNYSYFILFTYLFHG